MKIYCVYRTQMIFVRSFW